MPSLFGDDNRDDYYENKKRRIEEAMKDKEIGFGGYIEAAKDLEEVNKKLNNS